MAISIGYRVIEALDELGMNMNTQQFTVANVKCGGCVANIKNGLSTLDGVGDVEVDISTGHVQLTSSVQRDVLTNKLAELGHPEVAYNGCSDGVK